MRKPAPGLRSVDDATPGDCALELPPTVTLLGEVSTVVLPNGTFATNSAAGPVTACPAEGISGSSSAGPTLPDGGTTRTAAPSTAPVGDWTWLAGGA
jgi:hypothetical protein